MDAYPTDAAASRHSTAAGPHRREQRGGDGASRDDRSARRAADRRDGCRSRRRATRIERQAAASAVWIELDGDCGGALDELARPGRTRDVARRPLCSDRVDDRARLIDPVAQDRRTARSRLIVDADDAERAAALAVALAHRGDAPLRISDVASDKNAERLRQLSDEVSRIASTLARLSAGPGQPRRRRSKPPPMATCRRSRADTVRSVIRARRLRARYFPEELFADPAWDMLLDLLQAEIAHLRVPVSSLCIAAAVPATTALRWLKTMVSQGIFMRRADPHDGRRVFVELAPQTSHALRRYFAEVAGRGDLTRACGAAAAWHGARDGRLAQLVEHLVYTERVGGSSPSPPTSQSVWPVSRVFRADGFTVISASAAAYSRICRLHGNRLRGACCPPGSN